MPSVTTPPSAKSNIIAASQPFARERVADRYHEGGQSTGQENEIQHHQALILPQNNTPVSSTSRACEERSAFFPNSKPGAALPAPV